MKMYGYMIMKNEADRYLQASLMRLTDICDEVLVVDDDSCDSSVEIASQFPNVTVISSPYSFDHGEGDLRNFAWQELGSVFGLTNEWVFSIDADEELLGTRLEWESYLRDEKADSVRLFIMEAWNRSPLEVRVDGFWATNYNARVCRYGGSVSTQFMGGGSVPKKVSVVVEDPAIIHYGYATEEDRIAKFNRYYRTKNNGHNDNHIRSILQTPVTSEAKFGYFSKVGYFWRGVH